MLKPIARALKMFRILGFLTQTKVHLFWENSAF